MDSSETVLSLTIELGRTDFIDATLSCHPSLFLFDSVDGEDITEAARRDSMSEDLSRLQSELTAACQAALSALFCTHGVGGPRRPRAGF
jgi:hypothetical protein